MTDKGRTAYYFAHHGAKPEPSIIRADYGSTVKGQLGDGTHRTAPWRWVIPATMPGDFFVFPAGSGLDLIDLDQLEADIAMGKRLPGGDDPGEPEPDGPMAFDRPPDRDPGDEDDHGHGKPGHTPGTDPQPGHGNDGSHGHQGGGQGHTDPQPTHGNDGAHGHGQGSAPPSAPPQSPASAPGNSGNAPGQSDTDSPGKSAEAPGRGGEGHGQAKGHDKHGKDK